MNIASTAFEKNQSIPAEYTGDGRHVNPPLTFSETPKNIRYEFSLDALDTILDLRDGVSKEEVKQQIEGHVADSTSTIGLYTKKGGE